MLSKKILTIRNISGIKLKKVLMQKIPKQANLNGQAMDNYRPISTLPVMSKMIESFVHEQFYIYLKNSLGRGSSTEHAVTYLTDNKKKNMDKSHMTGAVFIELHKAFHTVVHACLLTI